MKKKKVIIIFLLIIVVLVSIYLLVFSKKEKKEEEPAWAKVSSQYHYVLRHFQIEIPEDFSDSEIIDIFIVSDNIDKKLLEKPFLTGVHATKTADEDTLLILVPETLGIKECLYWLPEAVGYTFKISKSSKKEGEVEINQPLLDELLKNIEYVDPDPENIYITG